MRTQVLKLDSELHPVGEFPYVASLSIDRGAAGDAPMLESLAIEFDRGGFTFEPCWVRVDYYGSGHEMLGCYWVEAERAESNFGVVTYSGNGSSVLMPASQEQVAAGSYCLAGSDAAAYVASMLSTCPGETVVSGQCIMPSTVVFGKNTTKLKAAWAVLDVIGWRIRLEGDGTKHVEPLPTSPAISITEDSDVLPSFTVTSEMAYKREYEGDVRPLDVVAVNLTSKGVDVTSRVISQRVEVANGLLVSETVGDGR